MPNQNEFFGIYYNLLSQRVNKVMEWDRKTLNRFSSKVERLIKLGCKRNETFVFEGNTFILGYATYLIEYLEERIAK